MKIAYFAPIPFDYLKQRPQHIMELLSEKHVIYYIEPTISLFRSVVKGDKNFIPRQYKVNEHLHVIRLNGCFSLPRSLELYDVLNVNTLSEYIQLRNIVQECDWFWLGNPAWYGVIKHFSGKKILYDKMDENSELTTNKLLKKVIIKSELDLLSCAQVVLASCQTIYEDLKKKNNNTFLIQNGVSMEFVKSLDNTIRMVETEKRIFGYIGAISHWFDFDVLKIILQQNEKNEIVLIGDNMMPKMQDPRVHYVGRIEKSKIPEAIKHFDICLYNFKQNMLLDTINPVKIYEYLALNKPVLAVESIETAQLRNQLMLYKTETDLINWLENDAKIPFATNEELLLFLQANSWEARVKKIEEIFNKNEVV